MSASDSPPVAGALVCFRGPSAGYQAEWTYWDSIEQAREAEAELTPCGPLCSEVHSAVRVPSPDRKRRGPAKWAKPHTAGTSAPVGTASATDYGGEPR